MAYFEEVLVPSAARTANGTATGVYNYGAADTLRAVLDVSAVAGVGPTLNVVIEDSIDNGATWNAIITFAQRTAAGREVVNYTGPFGDQVRARWTVGGTSPSFTFSVNVAGEDQ